QHATGLTRLNLGPAPWDPEHGYSNSNLVTDLSPILGLPNLEYLHLGQNLLSGPIPPELGQLGGLWYLDLSSNQLEGSIPEELGQLGNLEYLLLARNQLEGNIPEELGEIASLKSLVVLDNRALAGYLPWKMHERFIGGELFIQILHTQIIGFAAPPQRVRNSSYPDGPDSNGNASHVSISYFQGPLMLEQDFSGELVEFQTPVLGRRAMLAVTVSHKIPDPPMVITRVLNQDSLVLEERLAEAAYPITKSVGDESWLTEYYFDLPGELFQTGNRFEHVIDPENELAETDEEDNVWEPFVVHGEDPPRLRISFIPIQTAMDEDDWYLNFNLNPQALMSGILNLLPIADDFEARIGSAYKLNEAEDVSGAYFELIELWNLEAEADEFYFGIKPPSFGNSSVGGLGGQVALSTIDPQVVIPHEFGHNLSLEHPPGCRTGYYIDENYPYPEGKLGTTVSWDFKFRRFASGADERFGDVMSYCHEKAFTSISDYHYRKATEYWLSFGSGISTRRVSTSSVITEERESQTFTTLEARSLALSGRISAGGAWSLTQTQFSQRGPRSPATDREFTLILFDSAGVQVYAEPLSIAEISHSDESLWAARTPIPLRTAHEILILDSQGNEVLRQFLPELE
ncbi:MAG: hypothetical protein F4234_06410, partial [Gammaproteobacteria bacterium]|nr:hypothetical protein [Gammaproteobacteria bacterium]